MIRDEVSQQSILFQGCQVEGEKFDTLENVEALKCCNFKDLQQVVLQRIGFLYLLQ